MTLIDTAEMYADGGAERISGEAIAARREQVFVVSKVYPHNAGAKSAIAACKRSLARLGTDHLDCYLLHWRGRIPLEETVDAFTQLVREGLIRRWGVSNFDVDDMEELFGVPGGDACVVNQVLYNLSERAAEWRLLEWCRARGVVLMAYSPVGQGDLLRHRALTRIAHALGRTTAQVALAWLLRHDDVIAIPQSSDAAHVRDNRGAADVVLDTSTLAALDAAFPPPRHPTTISVI
jgi:diketogulonate reductase-like aldo/keto reductase